MVKYLKRFSEHYSLSVGGGGYVNFTNNEEYLTPNVSVCEDKNEIHYNEFSEEDNWIYDAYNGEQKNLRFTATADGCKIALKRF